MSVREAQALLQRVQAKKARARLADFLRYGWHVLEPTTPLIWGWHIELVCDHVQYVLEEWLKGQQDESYIPAVQNLLINVPPGTLKSRILAVYACVWMWLRCPSWRVLCLSVNPEVSWRDSDFARQLIGSDWFRTWFGPEWGIRSDRDATSNYATTVGGSRISKGITAKIIGERGDCIIVDDPNDLHEIHSKAHRDDVNGRWRNSIANRVNSLKKSIRIGIMQRGHEDDWSALVIREGWARLCLPMEFDPEVSQTLPRVGVDPRRARWEATCTVDNPKGVVGEVLAPAQFTADVLDKERARLGSIGYASQYQQRPASADGNYFKRQWWRFFRFDGQSLEGARPRPPGCVDRDKAPARVVPVDKHGVPKFDWVSMSVDAAFKKTEKGSRVAVQIWGGIRADRFLWRRSTAPRTFNETIAIIRHLAPLIGHGGKILVEDKANGPAIIDKLTSEIPGIVAVTPGNDSKEARAMSCSPIVEAGNVYVLDGADYLDEYINELCTFPNAMYDDDVDATSQLLIHYAAGPAMAHALKQLVW